MNIQNSRLIRKIVREAIYTDDYAPSLTELSEFSQQVRELAIKARDLGLSNTAEKLKALVREGEPNEWWKQYRYMSTVR